MKGSFGQWVIVLCLLIIPWIYKRHSDYFSEILLHKQTIAVYIRYTEPKFNFPDLIEATQIQIDAESPRVLQNKKILLLEEENYLDLDNYNSFQNYIMELIYHDQDYVRHDDSKTASFYFTLKAIHNNDLPFNLAQGIIYYLLRNEHPSDKKGLQEEKKSEL